MMQRMTRSGGTHKLSKIGRSSACHENHHGNRNTCLEMPGAMNHICEIVQDLVLNTTGRCLQCKLWVLKWRESRHVWSLKLLCVN